ncbi:uncharacterized protein EI90DRAFT_3280372 [Cantharellus anzutake]|uniref:uncharacterized protein n=1 Tax=Cantharellus anzutake TaxID=1750568 RepID=UPI001906286F|nr:uncharacterized protein EI90DRAFT_3280372 [Cantharellus anzutake]KAF8333432.1 hypothetical protein EI90DRAFT_3280372 [Cantharellus anzutake]
MSSNATVVLPGDIIDAHSEGKKSLKLGPGLLQVSSVSASRGQDPIVATRPGLLKTSEGKNWWIEVNQRRYIPSVGESVVGVIIARHADSYRVDIGSAHLATLDALAFEGASKRNRPNLKVGMLVYARVSLAHRDMDPELQCFHPSTHKADGYGELKEGLMVSCSLGLARSLLLGGNPLLPRIGSQFPFEIAIGINGRVWLKGSNVLKTAVLARAIEWADSNEGYTESDAQHWVDLHSDP